MYLLTSFLISARDVKRDNHYPCCNSINILSSAEHWACVCAHARARERARTCLGYHFGFSLISFVWCDYILLWLILECCFLLVLIVPNVK